MAKAKRVGKKRIVSPIAEFSDGVTATDDGTAVLFRWGLSRVVLYHTEIDALHKWSVARRRQWKAKKGK